MVKDPEKYANFAANLRRFMAAAGVRPRDVARALDISEPTVYSWQRGKRLPLGTSLVALAAFLRRDSSEFFLPAPKRDVARPLVSPRGH